MKRLWGVLAAATTILALVTFTGLLWSASDPFKAKFDRVRIGMTEAEVETIFEQPASSEFKLSKVWHLESSSAYFQFDEGRVIDRVYQRRCSPSFWEQFLAWIGIKTEIDYVY